MAIPLAIGQIVGNLVPGEPVVLTRIQPIGQRISLQYTGKLTNQSSSKVITQQEAAQLVVLAVDGAFSFTGDPVGFTLFAEVRFVHPKWAFSSGTDGKRVNKPPARVVHLLTT